MQTLIRLPKDLNIVIGGYPLTIENHRVKIPTSGLTYFMLDLCRIRTAKQMAEMEKTIQFEAVIEYCVEEIDKDDTVLAGIITLHYGVYWTHLDELMGYCNGVEGRHVAERLVEKIRNCDDWEEFWVEMQVKSQFNVNIKQIIARSVEESKKALFAETGNHPTIKDAVDDIQNSNIKSQNKNKRRQYT